MCRERLGDAARDAEGDHERVRLLVPAVFEAVVALGHFHASLARLFVLADELVRVRRRRFAVGVGGDTRKEPGAARGQGFERALNDGHFDRVEIHDLVEMAEERVRKKDDRRPALLRGIEGRHRVLVALGHGRGIEDDAGVVAARAVARLGQVTLAGHRRHAGARTDAHHVDDHAWNADLVAVADRLLHQAEARA